MKRKLMLLFVLSTLSLVACNNIEPSESHTESSSTLIESETPTATETETPTETETETPTETESESDIVVDQNPLEIYILEMCGIYGDSIYLQQGDVDGITAEMAVAEGVLAANPDLTVVKFADGKGFEADTTVSIGLKEGTRGTEFFNNVQAALDKISLDTRAQLMSDAVLNQPVEE